MIKFTLIIGIIITITVICFAMLTQAAHTMSCNTTMPISEQMDNTNTHIITNEEC